MLLPGISNEPEVNSRWAKGVIESKIQLKHKGVGVPVLLNVYFDKIDQAYLFRLFGTEDDSVYCLEAVFLPESFEGGTQFPRGEHVNLIEVLSRQVVVMNSWLVHEVILVHIGNWNERVLPRHVLILVSFCKYLLSLFHFGIFHKFLDV